MLRGIPECISPELLKVLAEMGHGDTIVISDAFFPGASNAKAKGAVYLRADGVRATELLDAILKIMPLDVDHCDTPLKLMDVMEQDRGKVATPVWDEYKAILRKYEPKGDALVGHVERFKFYDLAKEAYAIVVTGETAVYGNIILQKGVK